MGRILLPITRLSGVRRLSILCATIVGTMATRTVLALGLARWIILSICALGLVRRVVRPRHALGLAGSVVLSRYALGLARGVMLSSCRNV